MSTCFAYWEQVHTELNKDLYLSRIFPNEHNVITKILYNQKFLRELTLAIFYFDRFPKLFCGFSRRWYFKIFLGILIFHISPWADNFFWLHSGHKGYYGFLVNSGCLLSITFKCLEESMETGQTTSISPTNFPALTVCNIYMWIWK